MRLPSSIGVTVALALAHPARAAEPSDYVLMPGVVQGERAIDLKAGSFSGPGPRNSAASIAFEYSPTSYWVTELYDAFARSGGTGTKFDAIEWENRFQLTEPGEYAIDWGSVIEVEKPHEAGSGWNLTLGPLIQGQIFDQLQWNFNPLLARNLGGPTGAQTQIGYQAQMKYRYRQAFEFGAQGLGDLGPWYHWSALQQQTHRLGPAVFGKVYLGGRRAIYYNAGWLFGLVSRAPSDTVRAQVELEF
ncbi:MAG TPA: hypothetical protein VH183_12335 [Burkholderiaceae bacterium]|nr:hypothetical protein [Burkholderiaceae bacterium]